MGRIKALLGLAVALTVVYAGYLLLPVYFENYQFQDEVSNMAKFAAYNNQDEEQIHNDVMKKALDIGVPMRPENVHVTREGDTIRIDTNYDVVINLPTGRTVTLSFSPSSAEKSSQHAAIQIKKLKK